MSKRKREAREARDTARQSARHWADLDGAIRGAEAERSAASSRQAQRLEAAFLASGVPLEVGGRYRPFDLAEAFAR